MKHVWISVGLFTSLLLSGLAFANHLTWQTPLPTAADGGGENQKREVIRAAMSEERDNIDHGVVSFGLFSTGHDQCVKGSTAVDKTYLYTCYSANKVKRLSNGFTW